MLKLEYHPEGALCNDFNAMEFAEMLWNSTKVGPQHIKVGNWLVIEAAMTLITRGTIPYDKLSIVHGNDQIFFREDVSMNSWVNIPCFSQEFINERLSYRINF